MTEHRIRCLRGHWLFSIVKEGIAIKCRSGECHAIYVIPWEELDATRMQVQREQGVVTVPPIATGDIGNG